MDPLLGLKRQGSLAPLAMLRNIGGAGQGLLGQMRLKARHQDPIAPLDRTGLDRRQRVFELRFHKSARF